jgi:hypothetical protein
MAILLVNAILMNAFQGMNPILMTTELSPYEWNFWYECDFHRRTAGVDDAGEWKNGPPLHDYCDEFARSAPAGTVALQAADAGVEWLGQ